MTTLTPNERVTMRDFVRLKNIDRVAESEGITRTAVKHRLGRVYEKLRDAADIGDGIARAREAIASGAARARLDEYVALSRSLADA